jgi:hypothetical protein
MLPVAQWTTTVKPFYFDKNHEILDHSGSVAWQVHVQMVRLVLTDVNPQVGGTAFSPTFSAVSIQVPVNQMFPRKHKDADIAAVPENVVEVEGKAAEEGQEESAEADSEKKVAVVEEGRRKHRSNQQ